MIIFDTTFHVWIAIVLLTCVFCTKLLFIVLSRWYNETQMTEVAQELMILGVALVVNIFAIYGLHCSVKGGCTTYAWILSGLIGVAFVANIFWEVQSYKSWEQIHDNCILNKGTFDYDQLTCVMPPGSQRQFIPETPQQLQTPPQ